MATVRNAQSSMVRNVRPVWRVVALAALLGGAAACERALTSAPESGARGNVAAVPVAEGAGAVAGRVIDTEGFPVEGATVRTPGGAETRTGPGGEFVLGGLQAAERLAVTVTSNEYASTTAIYRVVAGQTLSREIRVLRRGPRVMINSATGGVVPFAGGGRVSIPANAFAGVAPGEPVSVQVTFFDPADERQLSASPGDFSATEADGRPSQLETAGMVEIFATDTRNTRLELAAGQRVRINFPDRDGPAAGTWGLYRFDPNTGTWVRNGDAPVAPDSTQVAVVPSVLPTWNADKPLVTTCILVSVADLGGAPRANENVTAMGVSYQGFSSGWTDAKGIAKILVRASSQAKVSAGPAQQIVTTPPVTTNCPMVANLAY